VWLKKSRQDFQAKRMADSFLLFLPENITSIEFKASTWRIFVGVARVAIKVKKDFIVRN